jgi:amidase
MSAPEPWRLDATALAAEIRHGRLTARQALESILVRTLSANLRVNALPIVLLEEARAAADAADALQRSGAPLGTLHGVPVSIKINIDQRGQPNDNGVVAFKDVIATEDSPVVANLRRAGAIPFARSNSPAFALRGHTDNDLHGPTLNPRDPGLVSGGSSGGAAVAVATGTGPLALGTDFGGSIRGPSYINGIVGLRPTPARIPHVNPSAAVARPLSTQLMSVPGPMARSVRDARLGLEAMMAPDARDYRHTEVPLRGPAPPRPIRVAIVPAPDGAAIAPHVAAAIRQAGTLLERAGYAVEEATPPSITETAELWYRIRTTEGWHLSRAGIMKHADADARRVLELMMEYHPPLDLPGYLAAWVERDRMCDAWQRFFAIFPLVIMPTTGGPPPRLGDDHRDLASSTELRTTHRFQNVAPLLGTPALAMPMGFEGAIPAGVQIMAARYREDLILDAAEAIEAALGVPDPIDPA